MLYVLYALIAGVASRNDVHRLSLEPGGCDLGLDTADQDDAADRHLRPLGPAGAARRSDLARILQEMAALGGNRQRDSAPLRASLIFSPSRPARRPECACRPAEYRSGGQMAAGLWRRGGEAPRDAVRCTIGRAAPAAVARGRGD